MSDLIIGKTWTLGSGTLGVVVTTPVQIDKIRVTWSGASDGIVQLYSLKPDGLTANELILHARTVGAASSSANWAICTQEFNFDGAIFHGLTKSAMTGVSGEIGVQIQVK